MKLIIEIFDYWHIGSGHGSVGYIDAKVLRDRDGLPYLPGKSLKGLLLDACQLLDSCQPGSALSTGDIFGNEGGDYKSKTFHCSDARMPKKQIEWLQSGKGRKSIPYLYTTLASTALEDSGTVMDKSLRTTEAALPLTLEAELTELSDEQAIRIGKALPLIRALGKNRNRGLGRCRITHTAEKGVAA